MHLVKGRFAHRWNRTHNCSGAVWQARFHEKALRTERALLAAIDRIIAISSNHARAAEAGQLSLFGAGTGVEETISLPDVDNVDKREMLNWDPLTFVWLIFW